MPSTLVKVCVFSNHLLLDLVFSRYLADEKTHRRSFTTDGEVIFVHGRHDVLSLDASSPHARACDSSRQSEIAQRRHELFLPILCGVARAIQAFFAAARTCARLLPGSPPAAVRRKPFFVLERRSMLFARRPVAASTHTALASRASCTPSRPTSRACWAFLVVPVSLRPPCLDGCSSSLAQAHFPGDSCVHPAAANVLHFFRLALTHSSGSSHPPLLSSQCRASHTLSNSCSSCDARVAPFHLARSAMLCSCPSHGQSRVLLCVFNFPLPFPHLQLLLILSQLFLNCLSSLAHPRSRSLIFLDCFIRVDTGVPMRCRALVLQSCSNSSRVGNRSHAHVDEPWSSLVARGQSEHAQIRHRCSCSRHGHDLHNAPHSEVHL